MFCDKAVPLKMEQGTLSQQAKVMQKCILQCEYLASGIQTRLYLALLPLLTKVKDLFIFLYISTGKVPARYSDNLFNIRRACYPCQV